MTLQQFGELYFRHEKNIRKVLNSKKIMRSYLWMVCDAELG